MHSKTIGNDFVKYRIKRDDEKTEFELSKNKELYWFRKTTDISVYWITVEKKYFLDELNFGKMKYHTASSYPINTECGKKLETEYQRKLKLNKLNAI